jgi:predicted MFS family arabinose efflux permease
LVANLTAGRLAARFGVRRILVGGALLMTVSLAGLLPLDARIPCAAIVGQLALLGLGLGLIVPAMTSALLGSVDRSRSGIASGTLNTARQRGSTIGVAFRVTVGCRRGCRVADVIDHLDRAGSSRLRSRCGRGLRHGTTRSRQCLRA